jgi:hypothetical protein
MQLWAGPHRIEKGFNNIALYNNFLRDLAWRLEAGCKMLRALPLIRSFAHIFCAIYIVSVFHVMNNKFE